MQTFLIALATAVPFIEALPADLVKDRLLDRTAADIAAAVDSGETVVCAPLERPAALLVVMMEPGDDEEDEDIYQVGRWAQYALDTRSLLLVLTAEGDDTSPLRTFGKAFTPETMQHFHAALAIALQILKSRPAAA